MNELNMFPTLNLFPATKNYIKETLKNSAIIKEPIKVSEYFHRGVGKTTALIEFAQERDLVAVVSHKTTAKYLREKFKYKSIYAQSELHSLRGTGEDLKMAVYDEGVNPESFPKQLIVLTGFVVC
ncbi:hypothetical protein MF621_004115 (plasmid) [Bacillus velezensis]|uniref:hypothetical protein n=1 Tax=Bacillus velezensis TaxID=492670 RepID=UPI002023DA29|nr:hypothetical protein [Bacillus velezensis]URJ76408.1 hypothetical protein MF619_004153 [Bacillus velezensis]URJ80364.1 hypothetical protein MF621_004115 [Bacillus velezensis]